MEERDYTNQDPLKKLEQDIDILSRNPSTRERYEGAYDSGMWFVNQFKELDRADPIIWKTVLRNSFTESTGEVNFPSIYNENYNTVVNLCRHWTEMRNRLLNENGEEGENCYQKIEVFVKAKLHIENLLPRKKEKVHLLGYGNARKVDPLAMALSVQGDLVILHMFGNDS